MDSNHKDYNHISSFARIDDILALSQSNYEEVKELPDRDRLTYTNGFYAYCSALFADIRDSSTLPDLYKRPALAKLYRAYISELVAIMNGNEQARGSTSLATVSGACSTRRLGTTSTASSLRRLRLTRSSRS